ncbi:MAG: hypothetical protein JWN67_1691 [Actinomycetia bacterium]|nr:hypothetical protein [Actinomycetes bacterium]
MTSRTLLRQILDGFRDRGWQDRGGAANQLASLVESRKALGPKAIREVVSSTFLARNDASVGEILSLMNDLTPLTTPATATALVLTALPAEFAAVRAVVEVGGEARTPTGGRYTTGMFDGDNLRWSVVIGELGPGNIGAAAEASQAMLHFSPDIVIFCGVAGGLKEDARPGTVVIAERVYLYESRKETDESLARPEGYPTSFRLLQLAKEVARTFATPALVKPIAAGDVLLSSSTSPTASRLRTQYNDAVAIDMESAGVYLAAFRLDSQPVISIRGISDQLDDKTAQADHERQPAAAMRAADFLASFLTEADSVDILGTT